MQKRFIFFLLFALLFQFPAIGRKHHKSKHKPHVSTFVPIKVETEGQVWGLDISHYQSTINWDTLSVYQPHFIFLKATEGASKHDVKYDENYFHASNNNIPVGSYHFFTYKCSGKEQAQNFLSKVKFKEGDLPPVLDLEFTKRMPPVKTVRSELLEFIRIVSEKMTCFPIIYCNKSYFSKYLQACIPEDCKLWIVDYKAKPQVDWTFWQTSDKHKVPGIKGFVDLNLFNGSPVNLKDMLFQNSSD